MFDPCKSFFNLLPDYLAGRLAQEQVERIEAHLEICPDCQKALEADKLMRSLLQHAPLPDTEPESFEKAVIAHLEHPPENNGGMALCLIQMLAGALAASALAALLLSPYFRLPATRNAWPERHKTLQASQRPISLESLLKMRIPRAALLWTEPTSLPAHAPLQNMRPSG